MKLNKSKKGFTLVELVIVIAVIGILAAVLIPTFSSAIEKANQSAAQQAVANARTQYLIDHAQEGVVIDAGIVDGYFVVLGGNISKYEDGAYTEASGSNPAKFVIGGVTYNQVAVVDMGSESVKIFTKAA